MEWYDVVLSYLEVLLSWPVIVLVIVLIFRRELGKLPGRLEQVVLDRDNKIIFGTARAKKITKSLDQAASKPNISKKQQEQLQRDIDDIFELGVAIGLNEKGKSVPDIAGVELIKDEKGNVAGLQYSER